MKNKFPLCEYLSYCDSNDFEEIKISKVWENIKEIIEDDILNGYYEDINCVLVMLGNTDNMDLVELLLESGADVNYVQSDCLTTHKQFVLENAAFWSNYELLDLLIEKGAEFNIKNWNISTPISQHSMSFTNLKEYLTHTIINSQSLTTNFKKFFESIEKYIGDN